MVIDTSAFVAIVLGEAERASFTQAILSRQVRLTSAATMLETTMVVLGRKGEDGLATFHAFVAKADIETAPSPPNRSYLPRMRSDASERDGIQQA